MSARSFPVLLCCSILLGCLGCSTDATQAPISSPGAGVLGYLTVDWTVDRAKVTRQPPIDPGTGPTVHGVPLAKTGALSGLELSLKEYECKASHATTFSYAVHPAGDLESKPVAEGSLACEESGVDLGLFPGKYVVEARLEDAEGRAVTPRTWSTPVVIAAEGNTTAHLALAPPPLHL